MNTLILAIALCGGAAAFLFAVSLIPTKHALAKRFEELEGSAPKRIGDPGKLAALDRLLGERRRGALGERLIEAGWYRVHPAQLVARMIAGGLLGLGVSLLITVLHLVDGNLTIMATAVFTILLVLAPLSRLDQAMKARKSDVQRRLPDVLDIVATTVHAGLSLNASLARVIDAAPGALGEELSMALGEMRLGRSRADALKAMAQRVKQLELSTTVTAIVQAERLGANLSKVLSELAEETRNRRMMRAEELAAQLPVKMVIPMALFMLPALFVMIFGAVFADYLSR
ncbi:type II secretion system F family protein [bacterium]|nr:MAG: type II secretion system F family protein [bacterium]